MFIGLGLVASILPGIVFVMSFNRVIRSWLEHCESLRARVPR